jgi:heme/copper-type cytochrome/quinol oxidase subunit 3
VGRRARGRDVRRNRALDVALEAGANRMSAVAGSLHRDSGRPLERRRGSWGMWLFIATEAALFMLCFFAYFYLGSFSAEWPIREDPSYRFALAMLVLLLASSVTVQWGQHGIENGRTDRLKIGLGATLLLGIAFIALQVLEYRNHLRSLRRTDNAYGSLFYVITSLHFAHVVIGLLMLAFVLLRAFAGHFSRERHLAAHNATLYWHFVDVVWVFVVVVLYLSPQLYGPPFHGPNP